MNNHIIKIAQLVLALAAFHFSGMASAGEINKGYFGNVAIKGYDPVAYFTEQRAVKASDYCASTKEVRVIVLNQGEGAAGPSTTRVEFIEAGIVEERPTPPLVSGEETTPPLSFPNPGGQGESVRFRVIVNANPADGVEESDTSNNIDSSSCHTAT